jgi:hypothetical protein
MSRHSTARSTANVAVVTTLLVCSAIGSARAASPDCSKVDAALAAKVLGVPKARANPSAGHTKQPPNKMDVIGCSYVEATHDPMAKTLLYFIYTPIAKDLATEYSSLSNPNVQGKVQKFSPGVGSASTGWVRPSVNGETFDGSIILRQNDYIAVIKIGGMPNIDALEKALVRAGEVFTKP